MKRKIWHVFLLLLVAVFPYSPWIFIKGVNGNPWVPTFWLWLVGLAAAVTLLVTKKGWSPHALVQANMWIKLLQIPAYALWFLVGMLLFLFMGALLAVLVDAMTILLSGLVGLAAVRRCKEEGVLTADQAVTYGILQFVFCVDVVSAIILYRKSKEVSQ